MSKPKKRVAARPKKKPTKQSTPQTDPLGRLFMQLDSVAASSLWQINMALIKHSDGALQLTLVGLVLGDIVGPVYAGHSPDICVCNDCSRARATVAVAIDTLGKLHGNFGHDGACMGDLIKRVVLSSRDLIRAFDASVHGPLDALTRLAANQAWPGGEQPS